MCIYSFIALCLCDGYVCIWKSNGLQWSRQQDHRKPPPQTGDVVIVADGTENPIGWGLYNSVSMFCVRLVQLQHESTRDPSCALNIEKLLEIRIVEEFQLRNSLVLPSASINAYGLVNSEGDRLLVQAL